MSERSQMSSHADSGMGTTGLRFLDVSGVGNAGKSAAVDLLREFDGVWAPEYWFEFDLLRVPGGVLELRHALLEDWSPVRSHAALRAFERVVERMGCDPAWWQLPELFSSTSQRYDRRFQGHFRPIWREFAAARVAARYRAEWPYDALAEGSLQGFLRKVSRRLGFRRLNRREVLVSTGEGFDVGVQHAMQELFRVIVPPGTGWAVLNNGIEPFNPAPGLDMLGDARQLVVTRDPRDVYVSGLNAHAVAPSDRGLLAADNDGLSKSFLATDDLEVFIRRFRVYQERLPTCADPRVLRLRFEDLVREPRLSTRAVLGMLGLAPDAHARPGRHFVPEESSRNVGLWRTYSRQDEIRRIEQALGPWLVET